jgi:GT2 family glycosyltransferase
MKKQKLKTSNIVIIDNGSDRLTKYFLRKIKGVTLIWNASNLGYPAGVNQGLRSSHSEIYVLINNDAIPKIGWENSVIQSFNGNSALGVIGAKIVSETGFVLESGSSFWSDGICYSNGRNMDPSSSRANRIGSFNYCSGAFLAINSKVIEEIGYFDEYFSPAYYEDADYCLRAKNAGFAVVLNPKINVTHKEHASTPADTVQQKIENSWDKFCKKHSDFLISHPTRPESDVDRIQPICFPNHKIFILSCYTNKSDMLNSVILKDVCSYAIRNERFITFMNLGQLDINWSDFSDVLPISNIEFIFNSNVYELKREMKFRKDEIEILILVGYKSLEVIFNESRALNDAKDIIYFEDNYKVKTNFNHKIMDLNSFESLKNLNLYSNSSELIQIIPGTKKIKNLLDMPGFN